MLTNRAALGALAVVGIVAAGSGAYIANRQHPVPESPAISTHDVNLPSAPGAVTETENSLTAAPARAEPSAPPVAAAPVRQANRPSTASTRQPASRSEGQRSQRQQPSYSAQAPASASASAPSVTPSTEPVETAAVERRQAVPEPPQKQYEDLV